MYLHWRDRDSFGIARIDSQHQGVLGLINMLLIQADRGAGEHTVAATIAMLRQAVDIHFSTEAAIFGEAGSSPAKLQAHQAAHEQLADELEEICLDHQTWQDPVVLFLSLKRWWSKHIAADLAEFPRPLPGP